MSITITNTPINYSPVYNPNIYIVSSSLTGEDSFRYVADIYSGGTQLGRLKSVPNPIAGWGKFDISGVAQSEMEVQHSFDNGVFSTESSWSSLEARFGWEYVDSNGEFVQILNNTNNTRIYFNASPTYKEYTELQNGSHPYLISGSATGKYPLTVRREIETAGDTKQWLTYLTNDHNRIRFLEIRDDDTSQEEIFIDLPSGLRNNTDGKMVAFRVDGPWLDDNTAYPDPLINYSVRSVNNVGNPTSEWVSFRRLPCARWELYSLYYLNRWGGIDSFSFNGRTDERYNVRRETYKRTQPRINIDGTVDWDAQLHGERVYNSTYETNYRLNSGWVREDQQETVKDLMSSPLVWMESTKLGIQPVVLNSNDFEIKHGKDGVISIRVDVKVTEPNTRQRS